MYKWVDAEIITDISVYVDYYTYTYFLALSTEKA